MRFLKVLLVCVLLTCLSACALWEEYTSADPLALPEIEAGAPEAPPVLPAAQAYLDAWKAGDYPAMYARLTSVSQQAISEDAFVEHYQGVAQEISLSGLEVEILSLLTKSDTAQVVYQVSFQSRLVDDFSRKTEMNLSLEENQWRIQWDDTLVMPELKGSNTLVMDQEDYIPARANIYDRNGNALVAQSDAVAVGLYPARLDPAQSDTLFTELQNLTGISADTIRASFANFPDGADWYLPLTEVPVEQVVARKEVLEGLAGLSLETYQARYYFSGGVAPHVLGYMGSMSQEESAAYLEKGYREADRVGKSGLEKWGEAYLAGARGGALYVFNGQGQPVTRLSQKPTTPGSEIYTTLDRDFQLQVQQAIAGFRGAIVVLERDSGRVLAMVSAPGFDPNAFEPVNFNSESLQATLNSPDQPLLNRAAQGLYPLGSVFKTVVMAAALESERFTPASLLACGYRFEELGESAILYDWTYEHFLADKVTKPSGVLTLSQGLVRSCNPWFYHIGLDLFRNGERSRITELAKGFGLGKPTGIVGVEEAVGNVPLPETDFDATNLGIGQGDLLVTPLQVAAFIAAIGNGGTLYRPQLVEAVVSPDGTVQFRFELQVNGELPVKQETLEAIRQAMVGVIRSTDPVGTAWHQFTGLDIQVAGKTGTATSGSGAPHAWFAGYTFEGRPEQPDIAVAVVLDNAGEGSAYAAPIFRRVVELYYSGQPQKLYPWESSYGVPRATDVPQNPAP